VGANVIPITVVGVALGVAVAVFDAVAVAV
jgi:hypothetical protein